MSPVKKILVPVDFSEMAQCLVRYAVSMARATGAELHFLHVYQAPVVSADAFVYVPDADTLEHMKTNHVDRLRNLVQSECSAQQASIYIAMDGIYGVAEDEIIAQAKQVSSDLILMGLQGSGYLRERLLGNTATHLFLHAPVPVLAIHPKTEFAPFRNVVFAYDQRTFNNKALLRPLRAITDFLGARLHVLSIVSELHDFPMLADSLRSNALDPGFPEDSTSYHIIQHDDAVEGLKEYCEENTIDLVTLVARKHSWLSNLLSERVSKKTAFRLELPVLALHD
jgi:nucleotide-binding universal stress UspA family protein